jgi:trehalose-phosphatase
MVKDSEVPQVEEIFRAITCGAEELEEVKITYGKKVYEVRPAVDWDKGKAIRLIVNEYSRKCRATGPFLVYIGDDRTDEDAFKAVREYDGISVLVGEPDQDTIARYFLRSPAEVAKFLAVLLDRNSEALHE